MSEEIDVSSHVDPSCWRYGSSKMRGIFKEESKVQTNLDVEVALAGAQAELDIIPGYAAEEIARKATTEFVPPEEIWRREQISGHDINEMVNILSEVCEGDAGGFVHRFATSYGIEDNRISSQIRDASEIVVGNIRRLAKATRDNAERYNSLKAIGRTHRQWAEPITFGFKFANYLNDIIMDYLTWFDFLENYLVGKPMTGAVGTSASYVHGCGSEKAIETGIKVMERLNLKPALITTQVITRKMHAKALEALAQTCLTLEKFASEVIALQRPEIGEVWEKKYTRKMRSSSAMPHKRNPIGNENIVSLSRVVSNLVPIAYRNIPLLHERDLTNSGSERIIIPMSYILTDEVLIKAISTAENMVVRENNVGRNLERATKLSISEQIMYSLVDRGMGRPGAYAALFDYADAMYNDPDADAVETLMSIPDISSRMSRDEIETIYRTHGEKYIGNSVRYTENAIKAADEIFGFD